MLMAAPPLVGSRIGESEIDYIDDYAGAGGSSQGLREAGLRLKQAANHGKKQIETHSANFPDADHLLTDLMLCNMARRPRATLYWASPECTWHSPAGGRKRKRQALDMFDDYVPDEQGERSRLTMMQVIAFAEAKRPDVVIVENVIEVADWELFETWLHGMTSLGYEHQILSVSAAHIWSEVNTPAPQWRDRVYFVFYRSGIEFPDVSPRPWALCPECGPVRARQSWKRPDRRRIGKYRAQYVYVCPSTAHSTIPVEPYVAPAMDALDLTNLGTRIADRPLRTFTDKKTGEKYQDHVARATARRIKVGAVMFGGEQEIVKTSGHTWDAAWPGHRAHGKADGYYRVQGAAEPMVARTSTPGDALVSPFVTSTNHGANDDGRIFDPALFPMPTRSTKLGEAIVTPQPFVTEYYGTGTTKPVDEPLGTVSTREHHALVASPYAVTLRNNSQPELLEAAPLATVTAGGNHHGLIVPAGAFLSKHHGGVDYARIEHMNKALTEPLPTMVTSPNVSLVVPPARRPKLELPMDELDRIDISDYRFRMLAWREHANAQRFPRDYIFTGNNSENTLMAGNAVASNVAHYLGILTRIALGDLAFEIAHDEYGLAA